jgi:hypothetical protein
MKLITTGRHPQCARCGRNHRSYETVAECLWPKATWISGEGPYAVLAHCNELLTVSLHPDEAIAEESIGVLDQFGCGYACGRRHEIIQISLPQRPRSS